LLRAHSTGPKIVFTTYQSSDKLAAAARQAGIRFDLAILDEAHKTVGVRSKQFPTLLREKKIKVRRRSRNCGRSHHQRQRETPDGHAFKSKRQEECVPMPGKIARSAPQAPFGLPKVR
jgi:hypothetical protein